MAQQIVEVVDLYKRYGEVVAVDHIGFQVSRGEIFGILGPNGAGNIVGSLATVAGLAVFGTLASVGIGFAISTTSKTPESANLRGSVIHFPMMFLSGTFWPRDFVPEFMQPVIGLLPLTPLIDAMRAVAARGEGLTPYLPGLAYLGAWGLVAFAIAAWRFRWE